MFHDDPSRCSFFGFQLWNFSQTLKLNNATKFHCPVWRMKIWREPTLSFWLPSHHQTRSLALVWIIETIVRNKGNLYLRSLWFSQSSRAASLDRTMEFPIPIWRRFVSRHPSTPHSLSYNKLTDMLIIKGARLGSRTGCCHRQKRQKYSSSLGRGIYFRIYCGQRYHC